MLALFPQGASVLRGASPGICPQFSALFLCIGFVLAVCGGQAYFWRFWKHACLKCARVVMGRGQGGRSKGGAMCRHSEKKNTQFSRQEGNGYYIKKKKNLVLLVNLLQN